MTSVYILYNHLNFLCCTNSLLPSYGRKNNSYSFFEIFPANLFFGSSMISALDRNFSQESKQLQNEQFVMRFSRAHGRTGQSASKRFPSSPQPTHRMRSSGTSKPKKVFHPFLRVVLSVSMSTFFTYAGHRSHLYPQNAMCFLVIFPPVHFFLVSYNLDVTLEAQSVMTADRSSAGRTTPFFFLCSEEFFHSFVFDI
jgi:hypothetical protein